MIESTATIVGIVLPLVIAIVAWALNMRGRLNWEKQKRKEERYRGILEVIHGFYSGSGSTVDEQTFESFMKEWRLAWVYCPDEVILAGNRFLQSVVNFSNTKLLQAETSDDEELSRLVEMAAGENRSARELLAQFVLEIRRDIQRKTKLTTQDYGVSN